MTEQDLPEALKTLKDYAVSINSAVSTLVDALNILSKAMPELPDKRGYYLTQNHRLLFKADDGAEGEWAVFNDEGNYCFHFWEPDAFGVFTKNPETVISKLGPDAFPLVPLSEVILPSEHIEEED